MRPISGNDSELSRVFFDVFILYVPVLCVSLTPECVCLCLLGNTDGTSWKHQYGNISLGVVWVSDIFSVKLGTFPWFLYYKQDTSLLQVNESKATRELIVPTSFTFDHLFYP